MIEWSLLEVERIRGKYIVRRVFTQIERTRGRLINLGQIIVDQGGWQDPAAIKGSIIAAAQCTVMGHRWVGKHPQTHRSLYRLLSFEDEDVFTKSWGDFQEYVAKKADAEA